MISAMDEHDVGWPDLAFEVDSTEWILSKVARFFRALASLAFRAMFRRI